MPFESDALRKCCIQPPLPPFTFYIEIFLDTVTGDDAERIFLVFYPGAVNSLDILEFNAASQKFEVLTLNFFMVMLG